MNNNKKNPQKHFLTIWSFTVTENLYSVRTKFSRVRAMETLVHDKKEILKKILSFKKYQFM